MSESDAILAGELALGLLEGEERAAALRLRLADLSFAAEVEWWRERLAALDGQIEPVEPPADLLDRLLDEVGPAEGTRPARWRTAAIVATLVAAALLVVLLVRPERVAPAPVLIVPTPSLLVATLSGKDDKPLSAIYDPLARRVAVSDGIAPPRGRSAELWVIAPGAAPRPLGLLAAPGPTRLAVPGPARGAVATGATLAVSIEPSGGSRTGLPTGPVVLSGTLGRL